MASILFLLGLWQVGGWCANISYPRPLLYREFCPPQTSLYFALALAAKFHFARSLGGRRASLYSFDVIKGCVGYLVGVEREEGNVFKDVFFSNALRLN